jgi:hypothetical protein
MAPSLQLNWNQAYNALQLKAICAIHLHRYSVDRQAHSSTVVNDNLEYHVAKVVGQKSRLQSSNTPNEV